LVHSFADGYWTDEKRELAVDLKTSLDILGLGPQADDGQAKRAYKAQVRRWHPDQFPEGSAIHVKAEERLKRINIAYARVKAHLAFHRPVSPASPAQPQRDSAEGSGTSEKNAEKRSWVDHLFDTLNHMAGARGAEPPTPPAAQGKTNRGKSFEQVLGEMAGGRIPPQTKAGGGRPTAGRRYAAGYGHQRSGTGVGAVDALKRPGPIRPVGRVRRIDNNR
jgi:DnaJ-class molecular chaperone